jgi:hypothetical protein
VGISLPLQFKRIGSGTPILLSVNSRKPIAATNHETGFQREMQENYHLWISMGFLLSVLCRGRPIELDKQHNWLEPLKPVFCDLKSKFPLILKIKYQRFNGNGSLLSGYNLRLLLVFAGQYL